MALPVLAFCLIACSGVPGLAPNGADAPTREAIGPPLPALAGNGVARLPIADPAVQVSLWGTDDASQKLYLQIAKDAGFKWVEQRFEWRNIEGQAKGSFTWTESDRLVAAAQAQGLRVIARVDNPPQWASTQVAWPGSSAPDRMQDWTDYLTALASRYAGRIRAYEIWNDPNLQREWGSAPDPAAYTAMLKASYAPIKAADPYALVVSAGLAPATTEDAQAMRDVDFYEGMYEAGAKGTFDLLGANAPGFKASPCADPGQVAADPTLSNPGDPSSPDAKRVYAFRHVEDIRQVMVENADTDTQIGVLGTGWTTDPRPDSPYHWHAVSSAQRASYLVGAFQCARQNWSPWLGFLTVSNIADPRWTRDQPRYWFSITNPDGSARLAYAALRRFLTG